MTHIKNCDDQDAAAPLVLVLEGEEAVRRLLTIKLARSGFRVLADLEGEADMPPGQFEKPDLVVLGDAATGNGERCSLVSELVQKWGDETPPIVMLSSSPEMRDIKRALECGCDDYVVKPFSPSELIQRLRVVLIRSRLRQSRASAQNDTQGD